MGTLNRTFAVVGILVALLSVTVLSVQAAEPVHVDGNPTCAALAPQFNFDFLFEYKLDPVQDREVSLAFADANGKLAVDETDQQTFDFTFSGNLAAVAIFAKASNQGNLYLYGPDGQIDDSGLHGPVAPNGETFFDLSHITFCIVATQAQDEPSPEATQPPPADAVPSDPDGSPSGPESPQSTEDAPQSGEEPPAATDEPQTTDQAPADSEEPQPADEPSTEGDAPPSTDDTPSEPVVPPPAGDVPSDPDESPSEPEAPQSDADAPQSEEETPAAPGTSQEAAGAIFLPLIHG